MHKVMHVPRNPSCPIIFFSNVQNTSRRPIARKNQTRKTISSAPLFLIIFFFVNPAGGGRALISRTFWEALVEKSPVARALTSSEGSRPKSSTFSKFPQKNRNVSFSPPLRIIDALRMKGDCLPTKKWRKAAIQTTMRRRRRGLNINFANFNFDWFFF